MKLIILLFCSLAYLTQSIKVSKDDANIARSKLTTKAKKLEKSVEDDDSKAEADANVQEAAFLRHCAQKIKETRFIPEQVMAILDVIDNENMGGARGLNCASHAGIGGKCRVPVSLAGIWHYGCWCNFGDDLMDGSGLPVSPHDQLCQSMQYCLRCAKMDAEDDGTYTCDPKTDKFNAGFGFGKKSLSAECKQKNDKQPCPTHLCMCEMTLLAGLIDLIWTGYTYEPQYRHAAIGGTFDPAVHCLTSNGPGPSVKECCGAYPTRAPYTTGGTQECCESAGKIFNAISEQCCADSVKNFGDPC